MSIDRFIVVDDNEANILFFQVLLQELSKTNVLTAQDAQTALGIVQDNRIQFVITAWEMTPMPGTVFIQKVLNERNNKFLPCLIYSKRMTDDDAQLTKDLGISNVLGMPFDRARAKEMIQQMLEAEENLSSLEKKIRKMEHFIDEGKPTEALKLVGPSITKKGPHRPRVKTALGAIWIQINKLDKAELVLNEALKEAPDHFPALQLLAKVYSLKGEHDKAIEILHKMAESSPKNLKALLSLGDAYVDADREEDAKNVYTKVKEIDNSNDGANDGLGKIAYKEGDIKLATELLQQTKNGDEMARFFNNLGISMVMKGDLDKGIETYKNALNILSDKTKLHLMKYNLGLAYRKKNDYENCYKELSEAYLLEPGFRKAFVGFARLVKEMKEKEMEYDLEVIKSVREVQEKFENKGEDSHQNDADQNVTAESA